MVMECSDIQQSINEELRKLVPVLQLQSSVVYGNDYCLQRRYAWGEDSTERWERTLNLQKKVQGTLSFIEAKIRNHYWMFVMYSVLRQEKSATLRLITSTIVHSSREALRKQTKIQLLALHHRSTQTSNYLFNIDFTLLTMILDTSFLVICSILIT
ncbi:hypothetical protein J6590_099008 [Homalodisca vitripennis]|nr:hypothetical protein J6590_085521 [Homalodisca vitripennis]KAG8294900.1 hypothetical protein J6590_092372 [Homalodisca vitripennis]KAG8328915.1 hypothetical protein J6590_099008 [Homalodisca vitripennis]